MKTIFLPSFCEGAIEGIDFLLTEYNEIICKNSYDREELERARAKFIASLEENKFIRNIEGKEEIFRLKGFKWAIELYGKLFISRDIENDAKFIDTIEQINKALYENLKGHNDEHKKATR